MLDAEQAATRLGAIRVVDWKARINARAGKPESRRYLPLVAPFAEASVPAERWAARTAELLEVAAALDGLDQRRRTDVMELLHPAMGRTLARWWTDAIGQPYTQGFTRRAFRAPRHPEVSRAARIDALGRVLDQIGPYDRDAVWLAGWATYLDRGALTDPAMGQLLAAAIDAGGAGGEEVFATLVAIGNGEHPIGVMGRHVVVGLLRADRADGWELVENLLLAAQRQEGLRQVILEAADEGHPGAYDRLLDAIIEHRLTRFAATVRAVAVWLGLPGDVTEIPKVADRVSEIRRLRSDRPARDEALSGGDAWTTYVALCSLAMTDVHAALDEVPAVLARPDRDVRAAAVRFLAASGLPAAQEHLAGVLADSDLAVAALAAEGVEPRLAPPDVFERLEILAGRLPTKARKAEAVGVEASPVRLARSAVVAIMLGAVGERPLPVLLPWLGDMDANCRWQFVSQLAGQPARLTPELRDAVVALVGDRSPHVRQAAVAAVSKLSVTGEQVESLEALLSRGAGDLRRAVIGLLARQEPDAAVASAARLWGGDSARRDAAIEVLVAVGSGHGSAETTARRFVADGVTDRQVELLAPLIGAAAATDEGLGLYDPARRVETTWPAPADGPFTGELAARIVAALDDVAELHRDDRLTLVDWQGSREVLLADARWLPSPFASGPRATAGADGEDGAGLVLAEIFQAWWRDRPTALRGGPMDALEAHAAAASIRALRHPVLVSHVLSWLVLDDATGATVDKCLDASEVALMQLRGHAADWRRELLGLSWYRVLSGLYPRRPDLYGVEQIRRWFNLARLIEEPVPGARRHPVPQSLLLAAHEAGVATDDDVYHAFFTTRLLEEFTRRRRDPLELRHPAAVVLADRLRTQIVEVERTRGDVATPASRLALQVASVSGAALVVELLARLGRAALKRGYIYGESREAVFSHLLRVSYPAAIDTGATVAALAAQFGVGEAGLLDLALYAPQWAAHVEDALVWPGLADAAWWYHAHGKDSQWSVGVEVRETWVAQTAERTALSAGDRLAGAVDVDWFFRAHRALGPKRWRSVHRAARLVGAGSGRKRAELFAEAMLGEIDEDAVTARIAAKRHQDSVRALGLLPLPESRAASDVAVARRYAVLREFERESSTFGNSRQASERAAVQIGIDNLARTAGYADPQRFVWATEASESADLAAGPVNVTVDGVTLTLAVDREGLADITVARGAKKLAAVPGPLKKHPAVAELRDRRTALARQATRVRSSLEASMVRQETFDEADLDALGRHPIVAPMLRLLVLVDERGATMATDGVGWIAADGAGATPQGPVRIAHPVDLALSGDWITWQERFVVEERRQPFKQVFRELYVLTDAERATSPLSHRYEGHQIQPRQALALFGRRGWIHDRELGDISRVLHDSDIVARVSFLDGFGTPAEVELPTIMTVGFNRRTSWQPEPLETVPPVVLSEVMRDLDLVVSVAHAGGVDPEATASTVEMRAALVRETVRALKFGNVREVGTHVVIQGALGEYSVHLGSGVVHRRPGGAVCIIPVNSQRRGRLFLPFADDDPKTAEVLSKVLLLADDRQIKDPSILEQLRS